MKQVSDNERAANQKLLDTFMQRWTEVVLANSKDEFKELYLKLKVDYVEQEALIGYLNANKYPLKHLFIKAWTDDTLHFGVTVTSRIEGGHSTLKRFLNNSKNDLFGVIDAYSDLHTIQYRNLKHSLAMQRDRIPNDVNAKHKAWLDPGINSEITPKALRELIKQHKYSQDGRETNCTGTFERSMGIPCRHTLQSLINLSIKVKAEHFHKFWRFERPPVEDDNGLQFLRPPAPPPDPEW